MVEKYLILLLSCLVLVWVIELVRQEKLTFKYAFGWIIISVLALLFTIFDNFLFNLAALIGFELKSDFILFIFLSAFVVLSLMMTLFLCQQNNRNDTIAQKLGVIEFDLKQLKEKMKHQKNKGE